MLEVMDALHRIMYNLYTTQLPLLVDGKEVEKIELDSDKMEVHVTLKQNEP